MGWLTPDSIARLRNAALALTPEQRASLTWDEAAEFVPMDTLKLAQWSGMNKRKDCTPWQAVSRLNHIEEVTVKRITGAEPSNMLQCENCKEIKSTTLEEIWSNAYPEGYLRRICHDCSIGYSAG
jgi:hypothetical protein